MIISQEVYDSAKKLAKSKGFKLRYVNSGICLLHSELDNKGDVLKFYDFYDMVKYLEGKKT